MKDLVQKYLDLIVNDSEVEQAAMKFAQEESGDQSPELTDDDKRYNLIGLYQVALVNKIAVGLINLD